MSNFYAEAEETIVRLLNCYTNLQRSKHEYCPGIALYPTEIHAIECIALTSTINLTELSKKLCLTRGAVSKGIAKLEKMGLVRRYKYMSNQKEVYLHLTELGVQAYEGHRRYHEAMNRAMAAHTEQIPEESKKEILRFLQIYLEQMQELGK